MSQSNAMLPRDEAEIQRRFEVAVKWVQDRSISFPIRPSKSQQLFFYGRFKQATCGDNNKPKPYIWEPVRRYMWSAHESQRGKSKLQAQREYVHELECLFFAFEFAQLDTQAKHIAHTFFQQYYQTDAHPFVTKVLDTDLNKGTTEKFHQNEHSNDKQTTTTNNSHNTNKLSTLQNSSLLMQNQNHVDNDFLHDTHTVNEETEEELANAASRSSSRHNSTQSSTRRLSHGSHHSKSPERDDSKHLNNTTLIYTAMPASPSTSSAHTSTSSITSPSLLNTSNISHQSSHNTSHDSSHDSSLNHSHSSLNSSLNSSNSSLNHSNGLIQSASRNRHQRKNSQTNAATHLSPAVSTDAHPSTSSSTSSSSSSSTINRSPPKDVTISSGASESTSRLEAVAATTKIDTDGHSAKKVKVAAPLFIRVPSNNITHIVIPSTLPVITPSHQAALASRASSMASSSSFASPLRANKISNIQNHHHHHHHHPTSATTTTSNNNPSSPLDITLETTFRSGSLLSPTRSSSASTVVSNSNMSALEDHLQKLSLDNQSKLNQIEQHMQSLIHRALGSRDDARDISFIQQSPILTVPNSSPFNSTPISFPPVTPARMGNLEHTYGHEEHKHPHESAPASDEHTDSPYEEEEADPHHNHNHHTQQQADVSQIVSAELSNLVKSLEERTQQQDLEFKQAEERWLMQFNAIQRMQEQLLNKLEQTTNSCNNSTLNTSQQNYSYHIPTNNPFLDQQPQPQPQQQQQPQQPQLPSSPLQPQSPPRPQPQLPSQSQVSPSSNPQEARQSTFYRSLSFMWNATQVAIPVGITAWVAYKYYQERKRQVLKK